MDTTSVAYVLYRIEDDSSLTPVSEHQDIVDAVAAGKHQVEVDDLDFSYALYADGVKVASFAEDLSSLVGMGQSYQAYGHRTYPQRTRDARQDNTDNIVYADSRGIAGGPSVSS